MATDHADHADPLEVPVEMRAYVATTVDQARKAFDDFLNAARRSLDALETGSQAAQAERDSLGRRMLGAAEDHVAASFRLAQRLVEAQTVAEVLALQSAFLEERLAALAAADGRPPAATDGAAASE